MIDFDSNLKLRVRK